MISGITRYTLGARNDTAIADVVAKAKELYIAAEPPPSSGVIVNSTDIIWDDMHLINDAQPVSSSTSYPNIAGPVFRDFIWIGYPDDWKKINAWFEVEQSAGPLAECGMAIGTSENTCVEITPAWMSWQDLSGGHFGNGAWHELLSGTGFIGGYPAPHEHGNPDFETDRGCVVPAIEEIRYATEGYDPFISITSTGNYLFEPKYYWWYHGWSQQMEIDPALFNAVYSGWYCRLVLIDPDGVDDRHLAEFVIHVSGDKKTIDGGVVGGGLDIGGNSRYKKIPNNGDWMPINFITGWIDEASLAANPPPFPTAPI